MRHKDEHMTPVVVAAASYRASDSLDRAARLLDEAERLGQVATSQGDIRTALLGIREARGALELVARLAGELPSGNGPITDPRWYRLRDAILGALRPYPEAMRAVGAALVGLADVPALPQGDK